jgi:hypothetical protein
MDRKARRNLIGFAVISVGILLAFNALRADGVRQVPYSEFVTLLDQGKVKDVLVTPNEIRGQTSGAKGGDFRFVTNRVDRELAGSVKFFV